MKRYLKYLLVIPPLAVCAAAVILCHSGTALHPSAPEIAAATEEQRQEYLCLQGMQGELLRSEPVTIPAEFRGIYAEYAEQQAQHFLPLADYAGRDAVVYTYRLTEQDGYAELLTADGILIGVQYYTGSSC